MIFYIDNESSWRKGKKLFSTHTTYISFLLQYKIFGMRLCTNILIYGLGTILLRTIPSLAAISCPKFGDEPKSVVIGELWNLQQRKQNNIPSTTLLYNIMYNYLIDSLNSNVSVYFLLKQKMIQQINWNWKEVLQKHCAH